MDQVAELFPICRISTTYQKEETKITIAYGGDAENFDDGSETGLNLPQLLKCCFEQLGAKYKRGTAPKGDLERELAKPLG